MIPLYYLSWGSQWSWAINSSKHLLEGCLVGKGDITRLFTDPSLQIPNKNMEISSLFTDTVITARSAENISKNERQRD